jgi:hypothetical protein
MQLDPQYSSEGPFREPAALPRTERFSLGQVVATANAAVHVSPSDIATMLARHQSGDWGDLDSEDRQTNEEALQSGGRLFSVYHVADGTKVYVITEWDRSLTTILLPEDY